MTPNLAQTSQLKFTSTPDTSLVVSASDNHKQQRKSLNPFGDGFSSDENESVGTASPSLSVRSETRGKKKRRAPLPPSSGAFSSARGSQVQVNYNLNTFVCLIDYNLGLLTVYVENISFAAMCGACEIFYELTYYHTRSLALILSVISAQK